MPARFLLSVFVPREELRKFVGGPLALQGAVRQALVGCYRLRLRRSLRTGL